MLNKILCIVEDHFEGKVSHSEPCAKQASSDYQNGLTIAICTCDYKNRLASALKQALKNSTSHT